MAWVLLGLGAGRRAGADAAKATPFGVAEPTPTPTATREERLSPRGMLPLNYRDQIVQALLLAHQDYRDPIVSFADPVRVRVIDTGLGLPLKEMTAVVYNYTPRAPDGSPYLMIGRNVALFDDGAYRKSVGRDSRSLEWPDGKPLPHADAPDARRAQADRLAEAARRFHDPQAGAAERRRIRRNLWLRYEQALELMKVPPVQRVRLRALLEAREEAPLVARYEAVEQGVDPFSGAMAQAMDRSKVQAEHDLASFFGADQVAQLEFLSQAVGHERAIEQGWGLELEADYLLLSSDQLLQAAKIVVEVTDPEHNEDYQKELHERDPVSGLSGLEQEQYDRLAHVLDPAQAEVVQRYFADQPKYEQALKAGSGKDAGWLLAQHDYAAVVRRHVRHEVLADYLGAVRSMAMSLGGGNEQKVLRLLVERQVAPLLATYQAELAGRGAAAARAAGRAVSEQVQAEIRALVGEPAWTELERRRKLIRLQGLVQRAEGAELAVEGCPLSPAQVAAVAEAFRLVYTEDNPQFGALQARSPDPATGLTPLDAAYFQRTAPVLTAPQQAALRTYRRDLEEELLRDQGSLPEPRS